MQKSNGFGKEQMLVAKGIFCIFLLFHHVFFGDAVEKYGISVSLISREVLDNLVIYARICVSGFILFRHTVLR